MTSDARHSGLGVQGAPPVLSLLGALGVAPFWLPVLGGAYAPAVNGPAALALGVYAAIILSFLAGARLGMAIMLDRPPTRTLCLAMVPPVFAWALVLTPMPSALRLVLLGLALLAHAIWDARDGLAPSWYAGLRWRLTAGATAGLLVGAAVLHD